MKKFCGILILIHLFLLPKATGAVHREGDSAAQATSSAASGLYVKNNALGTFGDKALTVFGDVYLDNADIQGTGALTLASDKPQKIVAHNSKINNLVIDNPTVVTLEGQLLIRQKLTVSNGVFDTRNALLEFADTAQIRLEAKGRILKKCPHLDSVPPPIAGINSPVSDCLHPNIPSFDTTSLWEKCERSIPSVAFAHTQLYERIIEQPPRLSEK
jgi:hypothetical protein